MISLGSQSQLGIGIAISLQNNFSRQARQVNQDLMNMRRNSLNALTAAAREYRDRAAGIAAVSGAMIFGMYRMARAGSEVQHKINQTFIVGGKGLQRSRQDLADFAIAMSKVFTRDPKEISQVLFENVKAGVGKGLEEITKYQVAVATATDEALGGAEGVGEKLLGITNAMGLRANEAVDIAGRKMTQFARVSNATTAAANATMASVYSIGESMEYFSNSAAIAGMTLEETLALVGKLSQSKITGSAAGTALNNMVQQLINSVGPFMTKKKGKAWGVLGIDPNQIEQMINQGDIYSALSQIDQRSRSLSRTDRLTTFNALFNMRGQRGIVNAFMGGDKSLTDIKKEVEAGVANDVVMQQSKAMMNDLFSDFKLLGNSFSEFRVKFAKAVEPVMRASLTVITKMVSLAGKLIDTPIGRVLASLVAVLLPMIGIMFAFRAALLGATLALTGMARIGAAGGFSMLFPAMLGMLGMAGAGGRGIGMTKVNAKGRHIVQAGQTVQYNGKTYKGGQFLPNTFSRGAQGMGMGLGNSMAGFFGLTSLMGTSGSGVMGMLGKVGGLLAKIAGFALRWLPVVGWIWMAVELLRGIFGNSEKEKKERTIDDAQAAYRRNLNNYMAAEEMGSRGNKYKQYLNPISPQYSQQALADKAMGLNQTITVNVDGKEVMNKKITDALRAGNNSTDVNFTY